MVAIKVKSAVLRIEHARPSSFAAKPRCPVCDGCNERRLLPASAYVYALCPSCGHGKLQDSPPQGILDTLYDESYFEHAANAGYAGYESDAVLHHRNAMDRLARLAAAGARPPGRMLDFGCASGVFLDAARAAGYEVVGVDVSHWARARAASRGIMVYESLAAAMATHGRDFEVVCFFQSLEHLHDPLLTLTEARSCLRPGGTLIIETWDRTSLIARLSRHYWQQLSPPSVVHLFSKASLAQALERTGFTACTVRATSKRVSLRFVSTLLANKYPPLNAQLRWIAESWVGRLSVPYRLGDLITVCATSRNK